MKKRSKLLLTILLVLGTFININAQVTISGAINTSSAWYDNNPTGIDYLVTYDAYVPSGRVLTINSGVEVAFLGMWYFYNNVGYWHGFQLDIIGGISANGTGSYPIIFMPYDYASDPLGLGLSGSSSWEGIRFESSDQASIMSYCEIYGVQKYQDTVGNCDCADYSVSQPEYSGGAIYIYDFSDLTIQYCNIHNNEVCAQGGGIYCGVYSSPEIKYNTITNNIAHKRGGGICIMRNSSPKIEENTITTNSADERGGGIYVGKLSTPDITMNQIQENTSVLGGGIGMCYQINIDITNNLIAMNNAENGGGIWMENDCSPEFVNNTIVENTANTDGGGIYSDATCTPLFTNDIIYFNTPNAVNANLNPTTSNFQYCDVEDANLPVAPGNIYYTFNEDPDFVNGYHLLTQKGGPNSPCVNAGNNAVATWPYDLDGDQRIMNSYVDLGCYENDIPAGMLYPERNDESLFDIYPNPSYGFFNINYSFKEGSAASICIYNSIGQKVYSKELATEISRLSIQKKELGGSGVYHCVLIINGKQEKTEKLVILD